MPGERLPVGFPFELDDATLAATLTWMTAEEHWPAFYSDPFANLLPELKLSLVKAGFQERERRLESVEARAALRVARTTLYVALVTLGVSAVALIASIVLALL